MSNFPWVFFHTFMFPGLDPLPASFLYIKLLSWCLAVSWSLLGTLMMIFRLHLINAMLSFALVSCLINPALNMKSNILSLIKWGHCSLIKNIIPVYEMFIAKIILNSQNLKFVYCIFMVCSWEGLRFLSMLPSSFIGGAKSFLCPITFYAIPERFN